MEICLLPFRMPAASSQLVWDEGDIRLSGANLAHRRQCHVTVGRRGIGGKSLSSPIQAGEATEPPSLIEEDDEQTITLGSNKLADYCLATEKPCDWVVPLQVKSRGGIVYGVAIESGDTVDLAPLL